MVAAMLQPQQQCPEGWNDNIHIEDDAGVARREVMLGCHLIDMAGCSTEREQARPDDRSQTQVEASERCEKANNAESQACRRHLELEGAVGPADEGRRHLSEEAMH